MKNRNVLLMFFVAILLNSCFNDIDFYFTNDERALFPFEVGDSFSLLKKPQMDTLTFTFSEILRDSSRTSALGLQYHNSESYSATFEQDDIIKGSIYAFDEFGFMMSINLKIEKYNIEFEGSLCDTIYNYMLNNKEYSELYVFAKEKDKSPMLYYTKEQGIVYIDSTNNGNSYSLIEYVKNK